MRMREKYEEPVFDMISFGNEDIVTTSPGLGGDGTGGDEINTEL